MCVCIWHACVQIYILLWFLLPLHLAGVLCVCVCGAFALFILVVVIFGLVLWP